MAHDERMLSQDEIDSLLKKIMPPTDKTAAKVEPASAKPVESTAKPEEKPADAMPGASFKTTVSPLSKETESPSQVESIKFNEYKPKKADTNPSVRPVEVVKREQPAGENAGLQKTVDDLSRRVEKHR